MRIDMPVGSQRVFALLVALSVLVSISTSARAQSWTAATWASGNTGGDAAGNCLSADLNADGLTDIACAASWKNPSTGNYYNYIDTFVSTKTGFTFTGHTNGTTPIFQTIAPYAGNCLTADFNSDGRTDLACMHTAYDPKHGSTAVYAYWTLALSQAAGGFTTLSGPIAFVYNDTGFAWTAADLCLTGNFFGGGATDGVCLQPNTELQTGSKAWNMFNLATNGQTTNFVTVNATGPYLEYSLSTGSSCFAGDINGDGLTDLVCNDSTPASQTPNWEIALSTGANANTAANLINSTSTGPAPPANNLANVCVTGDFNGDGITDLACYGIVPSNWSIYLSIGTHLSTNPDYKFAGSFKPTQPIRANCFAADVNGDGKTDIVCATQNANMPWEALVSSGSSFVETPMCTGSGCNSLPNPAAGKATTNCVLGDYNGDGMADVACYSSNGWLMGLSGG